LAKDPVALVVWPQKQNKNRTVYAKPSNPCA
jgi:hypothetical protein